MQKLPALACILLLSACGSDWLGGEDSKKPLEGKRLSVLEGSMMEGRADFKNNNATAQLPVTLPAPEVNGSWPLQQVSPVSHPALPGGAKGSLATTHAAHGAGDGTRLSSAPVVVAGKVYTLGADGDISAHSADNIQKELWHTAITSGEGTQDMMGLGILEHKGEEDFLGGNIAFGGDALIATTWRGQVVSFDAATGKTRWQRSVKLPIKSAPVIKEGRIFFVTTDNRLYALDAQDGHTLWMHAGIAQTTSIFSAAAPAATETQVVVLYSSGEIYALDARNGSVKWSDAIESRNHSRLSGTSLSGTATPVIYKGRVYASTFDGSLSAFDLATGHRVWVLDIASLHAPMVAGEFLFTLSSEQELVCIHTPEGKIKWTVALPAHTDGSSFWGDSKGERIFWSGPVLAGGKLFVTGSRGSMTILSPESGKAEGNVAIPNETFLPPVVAGGTMYLLNNGGELGAVR